MSASTKNPALIVGGLGVVGALAARTLRRLEPDLPIAIGGRDQARATALAQEIGRASAAPIDLDRPDLGLPGGARFSAVAMFVKDHTLNSLRYAQAEGVPYLDISSGPFEIAPFVALHNERPSAAPILLASHYLAGTVTLLGPALRPRAPDRAVDCDRHGARRARHGWTRGLCRLRALHHRLPQRPHPRRRQVALGGWRTGGAPIRDRRRQRGPGTGRGGARRRQPRRRHRGPLHPLRPEPRPDGEPAPGRAILDRDCHRDGGGGPGGPARPAAARDYPSAGPGPHDRTGRSPRRPAAARPGGRRAGAAGASFPERAHRSGDDGPAPAGVRRAESAAFSQRRRCDMVSEPPRTQEGRAAGPFRRGTSPCRIRARISWGRRGVCPSFLSPATHPAGSALPRSAAGGGHGVEWGRVRFHNPRRGRWRRFNGRMLARRT